MFSSTVRSRASAALAGALFLFGSATAQATTYSWTVNANSGFGGALAPTAGSTATQTDVFSVAITGGTITFDDVSKIVTFQYSYSGNIFDSWENQVDIGDISGTFFYQYENVKQLTSADNFGANSYNGQLVALSEGDGTGAISIDIALNGVNTQNFIVDIDGKAASFTGNEAYFNDYNPVANYVAGHGGLAYFILGDLTSVPDAVKAWYMSDSFALNQGAGRTGNYFIAGDFHGSASGGTEVPEPASLALLGVGALGARLRRRRA